MQNLETLIPGTDKKERVASAIFLSCIHAAAELSMGALVNLHALALRSERREGEAWKLNYLKLPSFQCSASCTRIKAKVNR